MEVRLQSTCADFFSPIAVMHAYEFVSGKKSSACSRTWIAQRLACNQNIIAIIVFQAAQACYWNYDNYQLLFKLWCLTYYYNRYGFPNLSSLYTFFFQTHYLRVHYDNYGKNNCNNTYNHHWCYSNNIYATVPCQCTFKWYMTSDTVFNSWNAFVYI